MVLGAVGAVAILAAVGTVVLRDDATGTPLARPPVTPTVEGSGPADHEPAAGEVPTTPSTIAPETFVGAGDVMSLDAGALADQLSLVERTVLDPGQPASRVAEAGWLQQLLLRRLDAEPALADQVIPRLASDVRGSLAAYLLVGRSIGKPR